MGRALRGEMLLIAAKSPGERSRSRLQDVDAQSLERVRHAQLFRGGHAAARGLFAITQRGVEKEHSIAG